MLNASGNVLNSKIDTNHKIVIILCDDISYSGTQLAGHINPSDFGAGSLIGQYFKFQSNTYVFLNIIGILPDGISNVLNQFEDLHNLIIPKYALQFKGKSTSVKNFLTNLTHSSDYNNYLKLNDCYVLVLDTTTTPASIKLSSKLQHEYQYFNNTTILDLSLIYPFQKYPDGMSTFTKLCYIKNIDNNIIALNVNKFIDQLKISERDFCTHIQDNIDLYDLLTTLNVSASKSNKLIKYIVSNYHAP